MERYDVIVVGGGPAGAATLLALAEAAPLLANRTLLLDRAVFPRPKLCGGGISGHALRELASLGASLTVPSIPVRQVQFILPDQALLFPRRGETPYFLVVDRAEFDHALLQAAAALGGEIRTGEPALSIAEDANGVTVRTDRATYRAEVVVGADGSNGVVRRSLGLARAERQARLLEVLTPVDRDTTPEFTEERAVFDFRPVSRGLQGYYWDFPTLRQGQAMMNRGLFDARILSQRPRAPLKAILGESLAARDLDLDDYQLQGHPERWFDPTGPHGTERVILVGDAAGADPLLGEGISLALMFGRFAANYLSEIAGVWSCADYTARLRSSPFGRSLRQRVAAARAFYQHGAAWQFLLSRWVALLVQGDETLASVPFPIALELG